MLTASKRAKGRFYFKHSSSCEIVDEGAPKIVHFPGHLRKPWQRFLDGGIRP